MATDVTKIRPPRHAPGHGVAEYLRRQPIRVKGSVAFGDFTGYSSVELFNIPANTMIVDMVAEVTTAWTGSVTLTIGDGDDVDRFMDSTIIAPATSPNCVSMKSDAQPGSGGVYIYAAADTIDVSLAGATAAAGVMDVWVDVIFDADKLGID